MKALFALFKKALTGAGILLLLAVTALLLTLTAMWFGWPLMSGIIITLALATLILVFLSIKKILEWRNKKKFVARILKQDLVESEEATSNSSSAMHNSFTLGLNALRRSPLGRAGNPLYALPWVLILGALHSGKTTLVGKTHWVRPMGDTLQSTTSSPLLWSFLSEAVILEGDSAFAGPLENLSSTAKDWEIFLTLLTSTRRREPLNGLVFTVSLQQLLTDDVDSVRTYAINLRNRLQQLMLVMDSVFPVYVVITGLDTVPGMAALLARLPEAECQHALGRLNDADAPLENEDFAHAALQQVEADLRGLLENMAEHNAPPVGDDLMALLRLRELKERLTLFVESVFRKNPHQTPAMLRGLYFTGLAHVSRSMGLAHSPSLSMEPAPQPEMFTGISANIPDGASSNIPDGTSFNIPDGTSFNIPDGTSFNMPDGAALATAPILKTSHIVSEERACFVSDLFTTVIPHDRALHRPLSSLQATRTRVQAFCLGVWYVALFSLCSLFTINTIYNFDVFSALTRFTETKTTKPDQPLYELYAGVESITNIEHAQNIWWVPTLGLNRMQDLERHEKERFLQTFDEKQLHTLFVQANIYLNAKLDKYDRFVLLQRLLWLSTAINMRQSEGSSQKMREYRFPLPMQPSGTSSNNKNSVPNDIWSFSFGHLFLQYLDWLQDPQALKLLENQVEEIALRAVNINGSKDLSWILNGVNEFLSLEPITMFEISGTLALKGNTQTIFVPPAFTLKGHTAIDMILKGLLEFTGGNAELEPQVARFRKNYYRDYAAAWKTFALSIDSTWTENTQASMLLDLASEHNFAVFPQILLLDLMSKELQPLVQAQAAPLWVRGVIITTAVLKTGAQLSKRYTDGDLSTLDILYNTFTSANSPLIRLYTDLNIEFTQMRGVANSVEKTYKLFRELVTISATVDSPDEAFQMAQVLYGGITFGDAAQTPLSKSQKLIEQIFSALPGGRTENEVALMCVESLVRFYGHTMTVQASNYLEKLWESDVAAPAMLLPAGPEQLALFGEKGLVTLFLDTKAKAFLSREKGAYIAKQWHGIAFPFTEDFLRYIQGGQALAAAPMQERYTVNVRSQPTSVNANALEKPVATVLSMQCQTGTTTLENQNFPKRQSFEYIPKQCGQTRLEIRFPSFTLTGEYATFADFLDDFSYGERTFWPTDFPDKADQLTSRGVSEITVRLFPDNALDIVARQNATVPTMPERIMYTW